MGRNVMKTLATSLITLVLVLGSFAATAGGEYTAPSGTGSHGDRQLQEQVETK